MIPKKLEKGDGVRVITPSRSLSLPWINDEVQQIAKDRFKELGLKLSFGEHIDEMDEFSSSSVKSRLSDLHAAFKDDSIKMIITVIGGFNSNQLLNHLDYGMIKDNPKILCGYSDITALSNSIHAKTGLVTYSGPHFFSFGDKKSFDYTFEYFKKCLMEEEPFNVEPSKEWSDDRWAGHQDNRTFHKNEDFWVINRGKTEGKIVGGNLCTFNLLHGTEFMPDLTDSILFLEDCVEDQESFVVNFDRDLQSIIHQPGFDGVKGIVIGRFEQNSGMTRELLTKIIDTKEELKGIPIIANVDFGHTYPMITFPIGGTASLVADDKIKLKIIKH
jgi:muramoyltetrapeptide carboxypeptidase LdcA involved in peptidoglycan recycling